MALLPFFFAFLIRTKVQAQRDANTVTDQAGNTYRTVTIGNQVWMAENLNVDRYRNGDIIPEIKTEEGWEKAGENQKRAYCHYDNNPDNGFKYGKLYNFYTVVDSRGLCPSGWRMPNEDDWSSLTNYLGGAEASYIKLKSNIGWEHIIGGSKSKGTNESGFSGLPAGRIMKWGEFRYINTLGEWWSSSTDPDDPELSFTHVLSLDKKMFDYGYSFKEMGHSVRCIKD